MEVALALGNPSSRRRAARNRLACWRSKLDCFLGWLFRPRPPSEFDKLWRNFRNRYGLVWAARVREQFNRAAANAGWPVHLYWQGLHVRQGESMPAAATQDEIVKMLQALLKRFA